MKQTCRRWGQCAGSPASRSDVASQRFHTNSQEGSAAGLREGKGRVTSAVSQK